MSREDDHAARVIEDRQHHRTVVCRRETKLGVSEQLKYS